MENLKNYYLITSKEDFFLHYYTNKILNKIFKNKIEKDSISIFDFSDKEKKINLNDIIEEINTISMFSPVKVIILKFIEEIPPTELEKIFSILKNLKENTFVILTSQKSIKLKDFIISEENFLCYEEIDVYSLKKFFINYVRENNKDIDDYVIELIIEEANLNPYLIKNELDKLIFYVGAKKIIEKDDFDKIKGIEKDYDIWALIDAIANNDEKKAFLILEKIHNNFEPEVILSSIFTSIKLIYHFIYYEKFKKLNKNQLFEKFGKRIYFIEKQKKYFEGTSYFEILNILKEADLKIKTSNRKYAKVILAIMLGKLFIKINKN